MKSNSATSSSRADIPQAVAPKGRLPGPITLGILIFLLLAVLFVRLTNNLIEVGGLDEAAANLGTYVAIAIAAITLWIWFCFVSSYSATYRIAGMVVGLLLAGTLVGSVRPKGITGNWIPTGFRLAWERPDDYRRPKPTLAAVPLPSGPAGAPSEATAEPEVIAATPNDFPQFLGPNRNGVLPDTKLSHDWDTTQPRKLWRQEVGAGWSGFAVVANRAVTLEQYGNEELVTCRDLETGELLWSHSVEGRHEEFMGGVGPRSTPTIHESKVYTVGATGKVSCLHLSNGEVIWSDDLRERYNLSAEEDLEYVMWGRAGSPLIYGDLCIVPAGGKSPMSLIAYDKNTGVKKWEGGNTQISYASPTVMNLTGKDHIVSVNESNVTGHDPATGLQLWSYDWAGRSSMNASASQAQPVGDNRIFISKGYDEGSAVFQVAELGGEYRTETVWKDKRLLQTKFTNAVIVEGHAYGLTDGIFQCVELASGTKKWTAGRYGHGQILAVGDVILVQTEKKGELVMVATDPEKLRELGRVQTLGTSSQAWNNLCLAGNKLLLRNADEAMCFELP